MNPREALKRLPRAYVFVAIGAILLLTLAILVFSLRSTPVPGMTDEVLLKCANPDCRYLMGTTMGWVNEHWVSRDDVKLTPGAECPKCGKNTLAFVKKCPHDGTVFFTNLKPKPGNDPVEPREFSFTDHSIPCPKCGWDPRQQTSPSKPH